MPRLGVLLLLLLLLLPLLSLNGCGLVAARGFGDYMEPCKPFTCRSPDKKPVPRRSFEFTANGCGTASLPISAGPEFADCCNWHDACYSTCGMKKIKCESRLEKCMKDKCVAMPDGESKENCESIAKLFTFGAQTIACPAYQAAQKEACRCVAADKVASATRDRLLHFLTVNGAPEEDLADEAVDALLDKYKDREPLMFFRLLMKYPSALKIDTAKRNFMDDIMRGAGDLDRADAPFANENQPIDEHVDL